MILTPMRGKYFPVVPFSLFSSIDIVLVNRNTRVFPRIKGMIPFSYPNNYM
jgi:hypothetical protein